MSSSCSFSLCCSMLYTHTQQVKSKPLVKVRVNPQKSVVPFFSVPLITKHTHKNTCKTHSNTARICQPSALKRTDEGKRWSPCRGQPNWSVRQWSPFTGINRALLRLIPDVCLCVLPALCALRDERECVWPRFDHDPSEQDKQTHQHCTCIRECGGQVREKSRSKRQLVKTTDLTFDVIDGKTEQKKTKNIQRGLPNGTQTGMGSVAKAVMHIPSFRNLAIFIKNKNEW